MSNRVGSSTIYSTTLPNNAALARVRSVQLSKQARHRLNIIEHYLHKTRNVSLTCRHYAITSSYFYKWKARYNPKRLASLENRSQRPKHVRSSTYDYGLVKLIRKLRTDYPSYSSKKLHTILKRDYARLISAATIGRIIKKFGLYFRAIIKLAKIRSKHAQAIWKKA